jgi:Tol biopolymer transport system component
MPGARGVAPIVLVVLGVLAVQVPLAADAAPPDGPRIAASSTLIYASDRAPNLGVADIFRFEVASGRREHVTRSPARNEIDPEWSPDGRTIAFVRTADEPRRNRPDLYLRDPRGREQLVARDAQHAAWSPDGSLLAFAHRAAKAGPRAVFVVGADGRGLRRLTGEMPDQPWYADASVPRWSPDGRWITFQRGEGSLSVIGSDGSGDRPIFRVSSGHNSRVTSAWSPDGSRLACATYRNDW